jgi:hypothetical protein
MGAIERRLAIIAAIPCATVDDKAAYHADFWAVLESGEDWATLAGYREPILLEAQSAPLTVFLVNLLTHKKYICRTLMQGKQSLRNMESLRGLMRERKETIKSELSKIYSLLPVSLRKSFQRLLLGHPMIAAYSYDNLRTPCV